NTGQCSHWISARHDPYGPRVVCDRLGEVEYWACRECGWDRRCDESAVTDATRTIVSFVACRGPESAHRFQCHALCGAAGTLRMETTTDISGGWKARSSQTCWCLLIRSGWLQRACDPGRVCGETATQRLSN